MEPSTKTDFETSLSESGSVDECLDFPQTDSNNDTLQVVDIMHDDCVAAWGGIALDDFIGL